MLKLLLAVFIGVEEFTTVLKVFQESRKSLAEILSAFEFMDAVSMEVITKSLKLTSPVAEFPFYILIETSGSNGSHDEEKLNTFLEGMMESGLVSDGTVATEMTKIQVSKTCPKQSLKGRPKICIQDR